ncbi:amidohydrolase family protein [Chloroflexota bacterium]
MLIVDTHVHTSLYWYEPIEVLLVQMEKNKVDKAVLVQMSGQTDNRYIIECTRRFPVRFSPVVIVDTQSIDSAEVLKQWVKDGAEGVRLTPTTRSPGNDPLLIWRTCADLGLPVTCLGNEEEFASDEFRKIITEFPNLPVIIEHLGHARPDELPPYDDYRKVLALAEYPNTYIKVGGLGEICDRPLPFRQPMPFAKVPPFIQMAYEAFGPNRMMWGSDYPPSSRREGYRNTLHFLSEHLGNFCSEEDRQWIFGKTALSLFKFKQIHTEDR